MSKQMHIVSLLILYCMLFLGATNAEGCNEPGTPNQNRATAVSSTSIKLDWNNTSPGASIYFDIVGQKDNSRDVPNYGPFDIGMNKPVSYTVKNLSPNSAYCFQKSKRALYTGDQFGFLPDRS